MRDINFFDELQTGKRKKTSSSTYVAAVFLLSALILGSVSYYYITERDAMRSEKAAMEGTLSDSAYQAAYNEALVLSEEVSEAERETGNLLQVHGQILDSRIISSRLIKEIAMAKPDAVAIRYISFTREGINLEGTALTKDLIAVFEYNLRGNERFTGPFIPTIQKMEEGEYYSFSLNFTFHQSEIIPEEEEAANGQG